MLLVGAWFLLIVFSQRTVIGYDITESFENSPWIYVLSFLLVVIHTVLAKYSPEQYILV